MSGADSEEVEHEDGGEPGGEPSVQGKRKQTKRIQTYRTEWERDPLFSGFLSMLQCANEG